MSQDIPATHNNLQRLASSQAISSDDLRRASAEIRPDAAAWRGFLHFLFLGSGIALFVIGVIFFFAYNWKDLHRFGKFGVMQAIIALAVAAHVFLRGSASKMSGLGAMLLIGPLFAVFGQVYQTGADAYELFVTWTIAALPFALTGRFAPTWIAWILLAMTSTGLYWAQALPREEMQVLSVVLFLWAAVPLIVAEFLHALRDWEWLRPVWARETLVVLAVGCAAIGALEAIFSQGENWVLRAAVYAATLTAGLGVYFFVIPRIFPMAVLLGSFIAVFTSLVGHEFADEAVDALWLGLLIVAQAVGAAFLLRYAGKGRTE